MRIGNKQSGWEAWLGSQEHEVLDQFLEMDLKAILLRAAPEGVTERAIDRHMVACLAVKTLQSHLLYMDSRGETARWGILGANLSYQNISWEGLIWSISIPSW